MPPGIQVATVAINRAKNAAILALCILGVANSDIQKKPVEFKKKMEKESLEKNDRINI